MGAYNFFINDEGHLRSGWRLLIFAVSFIVCLLITHAILLQVLSFALHRTPLEIGRSNWSILAGHGSILVSALLVGWGCAALLEDEKFCSLGWSPHHGWFRNLLLGSLIGAASLCVAGLIAAATRGTRFHLDLLGAGPIARTLIVSFGLFVFAAAAEEMLFRGYPLQTLTRANLAWFGVLLTAVPFAMVHLRNPNVAPVFTAVNTALAGVWLAVAYLRTRSLWLPLGLHWSWNWTQAALLGLPVSGIDRLTPAPLLQAVNAGPDWLTGGGYGIEGGAACTIALLISTVVIWRAKLFARADVTESRTLEISPPQMNTELHR